MEWPRKTRATELRIEELRLLQGIGIDHLDAVQRWTGVIVRSYPLEILRCQFVAGELTGFKRLMHVGNGRFEQFEFLGVNRLCGAHAGHGR